MKTIIYQLVISIFIGQLILLFSINLYGQWEPEGYRNGRQIMGTKMEQIQTGETEWTDRDSSIYEFDNEQRLVKIENLYFEDSNWVASYNVLFEYTPDGEAYERIIQNIGVDVSREYSERIVHVFNEKNQLVERTVSFWINLSWINQNKKEYRYDDLGNTTHIDSYIFENNIWKLIKEEVFAFDILGDGISTITRFFNLDGTLDSEFGNGIKKDTVDNQIITDFWTLEFGEKRYWRREINYQNNNYLVDSLHVLIFRNPSLELHIKEEYDYNLAGQLIQETFFFFRNDKWQPHFRMNYEHDNQGNLVFRNGFRWSDSENDWIEHLINQGKWTYSENGPLIKEVTYGASDIMDEPGIITYFRFITYYKQSIETNIEDIPKEFAVKIYPNPTNQFLFFELTGNIDYPLELTLINLQGQILKQQSMDTNLSSLSLEELPKGAYFVKVRDESGMIRISKIMKQ